MQHVDLLLAWTRRWSGCSTPWGWQRLTMRITSPTSPYVSHTLCRPLPVLPSSWRGILAPVAEACRGLRGLAGAGLEAGHRTPFLTFWDVAAYPLALRSPRAWLGALAPRAPGGTIPFPRPRLLQAGLPPSLECHALVLPCPVLLPVLGLHCLLLPAPSLLLIRNAHQVSVGKRSFALEKMYLTNSMALLSAGCHLRK